MNHLLLKIMFLLLLLAPAVLLSQTTIVDIQQVNTSGSSDASTFLGQTVTVQGVVTASAEDDNLFRVFLQQEDAQEWAGISISSGINALGDLKIGEKVEVVGIVSEDGGFTVLRSVTEVTVLGTGMIEPITLDPALFTNYSLAENEKYESMLVRFTNPAGVVHVVETNADGPNNNFGDWRVGNDPGMSEVGCRVLTGRFTATLFSSLNASYINDLIWENNSGILLVPAVVITTDSSFQSITGLMTYGFGNMRLIPRNNADFVLPGQTTSLPNRPAFLQAAQVTPNPMTENASLVFTLRQPTKLSIQLVNANGQAYQVLSPGQQWGVGTHQLALDRYQDLLPGMYYLRLVGPQESYTLRLVKGR